MIALKEKPVRNYSFAKTRRASLGSTYSFFLLISCSQFRLRRGTYTLKRFHRNLLKYNYLVHKKNLAKNELVLFEYKSS